MKRRWSFGYQFTPTAGGAQAGTITVSPTSGTGTTFAISGTGTYGTASYSPSTQTCSTTVGTPVTCLTTITVSGGQVKFPYTAVHITGTGSSVLVFSGTGTCPSAYVASGTTCTVGVTFTPTAAGTFVVTVTPAPSTGYGTAGTPLTLTGSATAALVVHVQTRPVAYTYTWSAGGYGACTGGSGAWSYGSWAPANGCGATTQTRSAACNNTAGSGTQTQAVTCLRDDGTTVANSYCTGTAPATSASCTPTSTTVCGTEAAVSQAVTLTDTCSYSWGTGAWSAPSSTCSAAAVETRSVSCVRSDGTAVATSYCSGSAPASSQTLSILTGCSYSWSAGAWGSCTGGSYGWAYTAWTPTTGCGPTTQTRQGTCGGVASSGSQSRSVTCVSASGSVVANSQCTGSAPASTQACTPAAGSSASCSAEGALTQKATLTNGCSTPATPTCVPNPAAGVYCVSIPTG